MIACLLRMRYSSTAAKNDDNPSTALRTRCTSRPHLKHVLSSVPGRSYLVCVVAVFPTAEEEECDSQEEEQCLHARQIKRMFSKVRAAYTRVQTLHGANQLSPYKICNFKVWRVSSMTYTMYRKMLVLVAQPSSGKCIYKQNLNGYKLSKLRHPHSPDSARMCRDGGIHTQLQGSIASFTAAVPLPTRGCLEQ
jgi:hypothetical protein